MVELNWVSFGLVGSGLEFGVRIDVGFSKERCEKKIQTEFTL